VNEDTYSPGTLVAGVNLSRDSPRTNSGSVPDCGLSSNDFCLGMTAMEALERNASDCGGSFYTHELELLDAIAAGQTSFNRDDCPDLDDIDAHLQSFADLGYVPKVVRAVYPPESGRLVRIDVVGGLTAVGQIRRSQLQSHR
jgi:hypothetical protein